MSYLLDTNILSETLRLKPNALVIHFLNNIPSEALFISVLTLGEIRKGIEKLETSKRKSNLIIWLEEDLSNWFGSQVLPITREVADRWGYLSAHVSRLLPAIDGLLAATALAHNLKMVTRNTKDFDIPGLEIVNPFD
ncbi:MAG TPA: type II toxin-antitoxin system VapC family toxin [Gammaproteobacteria bacterium]|nr:type II toxin-antitoxin system VapC family toxin [Gammaproteobacteria bacterium]